MKINKSHLVKAIAANTGFTQKKSAQILNALLAALIDALSRGDSVSLREFGKFYVQKRNQRKIRNPLTGKVTIAESKNLVRFQCSEVFKRQINELFWDAEPHNRKILLQLYELTENAPRDYVEKDENEGFGN
jgi:DNA-binding protein HU-beta